MLVLLNSLSLTSLYPRLHDWANIEQTSSKHQTSLMEPRPMAQM